MDSLYYERNRNKSFFLFLGITLLLLYQDLLQQYVPVFKSVDEFIGFVFLPVVFILYIYKNEKLYKEEQIIIFLYILFILTGIISSLVNKFQSLSAAISDLVIVSKFLGGYFFARICFGGVILMDYRKYIRATFRTITTVTFVITLLDIIFNVFPKGDKRFFMHSEKLFFSHPTYLALFCVVTLTYLTLVFENRLTDYIYLLQIILVCVSTFRMKAIGMVIIYLLFLTPLRKLKYIKAVTVIAAAIVIISCIIPQINAYYFDSDDSPRNLLTSTGIKIANDYFPMGSGLGTFGSYISGAAYSPLYYMYNLSSTWGLTKNNPFFISDTFWPMILGQFGYMGLFLFILVILQFSLLIKKLRDFDSNILLFCLIPFIYLLVSSTSESSFANYYSVNLFMIIGMAVSQTRQVDHLHNDASKIIKKGGLECQR